MQPFGLSPLHEPEPIGEVAAILLLLPDPVHHRIADRRLVRGHVTSHRPRHGWRPKTMIAFPPFTRDSPRTVRTRLPRQWAFAAGLRARGASPRPTARG